MVGFTSNWGEFQKITKNLQKAWNPGGTFKSILEATGKTAVTGARKDARKKTHAMEKSTDYQMVSDTLVIVFVGVDYGRWQDEGTRFMEGNFFFTNNLNRAWANAQKIFDLYLQWLTTHEFNPSYRVPQTMGVTGITTGTVQGHHTARIKTKRLVFRKRKRPRK